MSAPKKVLDMSYGKRREVLRDESNGCGQRAIVGMKNATEGFDDPNHARSVVASPILHGSLLEFSPRDP